MNGNTAKTRGWLVLPALAWIAACGSSDAPAPWMPNPTGGDGQGFPAVQDAGAVGTSAGSTTGFGTSTGTGTGTGTGTTAGAPTTTGGGVGGTTTAGPSTTGGGDGGVPGTEDGGSMPAEGGVAQPDAGANGGAGQEDPVCDVADPSEFEPNSVGGGGTPSKETEHFRIFTSGAADVETTAKNLEAAYSCFVEDGCWRSPGLSITSDDGQHHKVNIYGTGSLGAAAGVMRYDQRAGLSYLEVVNSYLPAPRVTVHEFGHGMHLAAKGWVDQTRTGAWWETVANFVADSFLTASYCEAARTRFGLSEGETLITLDTVIGRSHLAIVDGNANHYEAWPFLTYLTTNLDSYPGLGRMALPRLFEQHNRNNETPLHVLERVAAPIKVQTILGRYWARMAYLDIGHPKAQAAFMSQRGRLNFDALDAAGGQTYRVKSARRPAYGGANIIPLNVTGGEVSVVVTNLADGQAGSNLTATVSIRGSGGSVRYVDLIDGAGQATVSGDEEASLVVVNTPDELIMYDPFDRSGPALEGMNYEVELTGATPAN